MAYFGNGHRRIIYGVERGEGGGEVDRVGILIQMGPLAGKIKSLSPWPQELPGKGGIIWENFVNIRSEFTFQEICRVSNHGLPLESVRGGGGWEWSLLIKRNKWAGHFNCFGGECGVTRRSVVHPAADEGAPGDRKHDEAASQSKDHTMLW